MAQSIAEAALGRNADRARILATAASPEGGRAIVLVRFDNGHELHRLCVRKENSWELSEHDPAANADVMFVYEAEDRYLWAISGQFPAGATAVIVERADEQLRIERDSDSFLAVWWDLEETAHGERPEIVRFE